MKYLILSLLCLIGLFLTPTGLIAQTVSESDGVASNTTKINSSTNRNKYEVEHTPDYQTTKQALLKTFKSQIISYQAAYKQFTLAKKQYEQLETLESLNSAIEATKQVVLKRNEVISTYIEILHLELIQRQPSLHPNLRGQTIKRTEQLMTQLAEFRQDVASAVSREDLHEVLADYKTLFQQIQYLSYQSRLILKVDTLYRLGLELKDLKQSVIDQEALITGGDKFKAIKFYRGIDEIDKEFAQYDASLQKLKSNYLNKDKTSPAWFKQANTELIKVYLAELRTSDYLLELLRPVKPTNIND
jgi:hypothetical protein